MLSAILLKTVLAPAAFGFALAILMLVFQRRKVALLGALLPVLAAAVYILLEGLPAFPPVGGVYAGLHSAPTHLPSYHRATDPVLIDAPGGRSVPSPAG